MTARLGWFGKLPSIGDFAGAGLSRETIDAWDGWVVSVLPTVLAAWDALDAPDGWLRAPRWRFVLPAGQCGARALGGLMLPSRDRLERRYPLLAAVEGSLPDTRALDEAERILVAAANRGSLPRDVSAALVRIAPCNGKPPGQALWWRVDEAPLHLGRMPDPTQAATMLAPA